MHDSENGRYASTGKHAETVEVLLEAGAARPLDISGSAAVRAVLQRKI